MQTGRTGLYSTTEASACDMLQPDLTTQFVGEIPGRENSIFQILFRARPFRKPSQTKSQINSGISFYMNETVNQIHSL